MNLRPYQSAFCASVERGWKNHNSVIATMFTGLGKTICLAELVRRAQPGRSIVIAHREELIFQARDKIRAHTGMSMEVEMGDYRASTESGLFEKSSGVVSSIQTLTSGGDGAGRMTKFDPQSFVRLFIDECHHATASTYRRSSDYFSQNPNLKTLGVTATPDRADEESLGQVFEDCVFEYEAEDAIKDGWLVPVAQKFASVGELDFSNVRTTAGDLNGADLAAVMEAEKALYPVADASFQTIGNRRALAFCASVNHARMLSEILNRYRPNMSAWICGKTEKEDRRRILSEYSEGKIQVICNCGVLTEGYDDVGIEYIIMARPTKSRSLYAQMLGRGTRPLPGIVDNYKTAMGRRFAIQSSQKPQCVVLDFSGNSGKHKLVSAADILGGKVSEEAIQQAMDFAKHTGKPVRMDELLADEEERINQRRIEEEARRARLIVKAKVSWRNVDPFDLLQIKPVTKERGWDKDKTFSEKQAAMLRRNGVDPDGVSYTQGKQLIGAIGDRISNGLCSLGQMKMLKKYGIDTNVTFEHAHRIIDSIANNGWKKPAVLPDAISPNGAQRDSATAISDYTARETKGTSQLQPAGGFEDDNIPF